MQGSGDVVQNLRMSELLVILRRVPPQNGPNGLSVLRSVVAEISPAHDSAIATNVQLAEISRPCSAINKHVVSY